MFNNEIADEIIKSNNIRILSSMQLIEPHLVLGEISKDCKTEGTNESALSETEKAMLMEIYNHPYRTVTRHYDNGVAGEKLSAGKGGRLINKLVQKHLIAEHAINLGGRGGGAKLVELKDKGYKAIGMKPKPGIGRGADWEHGFWQYHISERLKDVQGIKKATIEGRLLDKFIDVLVETENEKIAIEIEMTPNHALVNIEKDLSAGCSKVFVGCKDKSVLENINRIVESFPDEMKVAIVVCLVQKIVSEVKKHVGRTYEEKTERNT